MPALPRKVQGVAPLLSREAELCAAVLGQEAVRPCFLVTWLGPAVLLLGMSAAPAFPPPTLLFYLQKVESCSDSDSKVDSDSEMGNATVDMTKSDSNSDSDSDVSVKKPQRGRKPGNTKETSPTATEPLLASSGYRRAREIGCS